MIISLCACSNFGHNTEGPPDSLPQSPSPVPTVDPALPPDVAIEVKDGETFTVHPASYDWEYPDDSGTLCNVTTCGVSPLEYAGDPDSHRELTIVPQDSTDGTVKLVISEHTSFTISSWIEGATCGVSDPVYIDGDAVISLPEGGHRYIYELSVTYPSGDARYVFCI